MADGVMGVCGWMTGDGWMNEISIIFYILNFSCALLTRESRQGFFCVLL